MKQIFEINHIQVVNGYCKDLNWPQLTPKSMHLIENWLVFIIEDHWYYLIFDLTKKIFTEKQHYLLSDINQPLEVVTSGYFGDVPNCKFSAFGYYKINCLHLAIQYFQKVRRLYNCKRRFKLAFNRRA